MPDLLLELLTEEIPARMQAAAAKNLRALADCRRERKPPARSAVDLGWVRRRRRWKDS